MLRISKSLVSVVLQYDESNDLRLQVESENCILRLRFSVDPVNSARACEVHVPLAIHGDGTGVNRQVLSKELHGAVRLHPVNTKLRVDDPLQSTLCIHV